MRKKYAGLLLLAVMLLCIFCGCNKETVSEITETTEPSVQATTPPPGNPEDVTCKGSYSRTDWVPEGVAATLGDHVLTNEALQVWYQLAVAEYRQGAYESAPDFSQPLDIQECPIDDTVNSWEQYFLKQALQTWHSVYALELQAREEPLPTEEAYNPMGNNYETYLTDIPATDYLYGYNPLYQPNSMHDAYLTNLSQTLAELAKEKGYRDLEDLAQRGFGVDAEVLTETVRMYNYSYMYFTTLSYYIESTQEDVTSFMLSQGSYPQQDQAVTFRQILLLPDGEKYPPVTVAKDGTVNCTESAWEACMKEADAMLLNWQRKLRCCRTTSSGTSSVTFKAIKRRRRRNCLATKMRRSSLVTLATVRRWLLSRTAKLWPFTISVMVFIFIPKRISGLSLP